MVRRRASMKFACETCSTKYVIPDERVAGKLLRVRCKRCRGVMEVLGPGRQTTKSEKLPGVRSQDVAQDRPLFSTRQGIDPFVAAGGSGSWKAGGVQARTFGTGDGVATERQESVQLVPALPGGQP